MSYPLVNGKQEPTSCLIPSDDSEGVKEVVFDVDARRGSPQHLKSDTGHNLTDFSIIPTAGCAI